MRRIVRRVNFSREVIKFFFLSGYFTTGYWESITKSVYTFQLRPLVKLPESFTSLYPQGHTLKVETQYIDAHFH
jgi:hypothetical protein